MTEDGMNDRNFTAHVANVARNIRIQNAEGFPTDILERYLENLMDEARSRGITSKVKAAIEKGAAHGNR